MKDTLIYLVKGIVDNADTVKVSEAEEDGVVTFSITVDPSDMGKVIGKSGKVIRAIRNVMKIKAIKQNKKIHILLNETQEG